MTGTENPRRERPDHTPIEPPGTVGGAEVQRLTTRLGQCPLMSQYANVERGGLPMRVGLRTRTLSDDRLAFCKQIGVDDETSNFDPLSMTNALRDAGFSGVTVPDHVPGVIDDTDWGHRSRARAVGHLKGLVRCSLGND